MWKCIKEKSRGKEGSRQNATGAQVMFPPVLLSVSSSDFQLCSQAGSLCICKRVSSSNWGNMLSPSCLVKERAKPLPQELNACTFPPSIWTLLEHMPTHGPIASSEMPWMDWVSIGWTGCQEGFNCIYNPWAFSSPS